MKRGRRSGASLTVLTLLPEQRRPVPPDELTDEQRVVWQATVNAMPHDWFSREGFPVLTDYCRHVVRSRRLDAEIEKHGDADPTLLGKLYIMAEREGRAVLAHARYLSLARRQPC